MFILECRYVENTTYKKHWKLQALGEFLLSWGGLGVLPEGLFLSGTLPSALVYPGTGRGWFHLKSGSLKTGPGTRCFLRNT